MRIGGASTVRGEDERIPVIGVGDVEEPGAGVLGRERERGHPRLAARTVRLDEVADVQERAVQQAIVRDHPDRAALLCDVEIGAGARRLGQVDGVLEFGDALRATYFAPSVRPSSAVRPTIAAPTATSPAMTVSIRRRLRAGMVERARSTLSPLS